MKGFIDKALNAARKYNVWDFGWFKIALVSIGILFGTYFAPFFIRYIMIIWILFAITYIWLIYKTFFKYWNKK